MNNFSERISKCFGFNPKFYMDVKSSTAGKAIEYYNTHPEEIPEGKFNIKDMRGSYLSSGDYSYIDAIKRLKDYGNKAVIVHAK